MRTCLRGCKARYDRRMVRVQELNFYPLKSGRRITLDAVRVQASGFPWDRHWMMVDGAGRFLTQRTHPRLARVRPQLSARTLTLNAPGLTPLVLPLEPVGIPTPVRIWQDDCEGLDQGDEATGWCSQALEARARLLRVPREPARRANPRYAGSTSVPLAFVDGYPILVCNAASLQELNTRLDAPIPMERFRPNIVLEGLPAFAEDHIARVRIGTIVLQLVKPCTRCVIPSIDQSSGTPALDPTPALRAFRFDRELKGVTFGENAVPTAGIGAEIRCGDRCEVESD